ncbi:MAG: HAD-IC family P-type ATPase [Clostridium luticellarii]|uniref:Cd(2+)-exporting ATPase n=1 Tax=Clostridium luticellarii TaxID=1691940 RepID=A0A2T0BQR3_9CLOT|nr:HAD-IC family P-type ATPase [Clostridium luticellarii]MCI1995666.1 HAD-IC family P-type ATPase [Clostridium luticellarii]MCI2040254.1 HAD-IC family P-type ATPase [Clostridium luticellarii]PRR86172.1 Cadmium, zinc and cobalt-transporting ATPase [Clostridium luticellarii]
MRELSVLPGRVRFKCNEMYLNKELAEYIDVYTEGLYGVEYSKVNYNSGTILVLYDETKTNLKSIKGSIEQTLTSEIDYNEVFGQYSSYHNIKHKKEIVKTNFIRSILVYLFFKIKQRIFGKFFLSGSLAMVEIASLVTIVGGYSIFRSVYNRLAGRMYPHPDVFLKLAGLILTISRESTEGLFLILLTDFKDYMKASADLKCQCLLKKSIIRPPGTAWIAADNGSEILTSVKSLQIGDTILVHEGEVIPVDGKVLEGKAAVNSLYYTGQPLVSLVEEGSKVYEGIIVMSGEIKVRILRLAEPLEKKDISVDKLHLRKKILVYENRAVSIAVVLSVLNYAATGNLLNALSIILLLCPASSELALSTALKNYVYLMSRHNIYIKNPNTFEKVATTDSVVFDKTGTLTYKDMSIAHIESFDENYTDEDLLRICAFCESDSCKKITDTPRNMSGETDFNNVREKLEKVILVPSKGISTKYNNHKVLIGDDDFLRENSIVLDDVLDRYTYYEHSLYNPMLVSVDNLVVGLIVIQENIREGACDLIKKLRSNHIDNISLATGDCCEKGRYVADKLGIENVYGRCNNDEKLQIVLKQKPRGTVMMVGDGINDILSMRAADVSVSFADCSSDYIKFNSDCIIFDEDINKLNDLIILSRKAYGTIQQNIEISNLFNILLGTLAFLGGFDAFAAKSIDTINSILVLVMNERVRLIPKWLK